MNLKDKLNTVRKHSSTEPRKIPLWGGPEQDGVTFSLLSRFLVCRERFRLLVVEGLRPSDKWNHRIHYGQMWHTCEEAVGSSVPRVNRWEIALADYCKGLSTKYPFDREQIDHWYNVCLKQFAIYLDYWSKNKDQVERRVLLPEQVFKVPYQLPSGRTVLLKGKWDSVDLIGTGDSAAIYLQENKTKGDINERQLKRQLTFDLQTMLYLVALKEWQHPKKEQPVCYGPEEFNDRQIAGVRYNVVKRPLSGGKGTIVRYKPSKTHPYGEPKEAFYKRVAAYIQEEPQEFFMRWRVEVGQHDIQKFQHECLNPLLESLCDWWSWVKLSQQGSNYGPFSPNDGCENSVDRQVNSYIHWRHPFGVYNAMDEGGSTDLDEYLSTGSELGLTRVDNLFPELEAV